MEKLKNIERKLDELGIDWFRSEDGQSIEIKACEIGNNFYDYGEEPTPIVFNKKYEFLKGDHRIHILDCQACCGCAGW